jgi:hypothetical protein
VPAVLIFIVLPIVLIALSFRVRPLRRDDDTHSDVLGAGLAARGLFGDAGLKPDPKVVPEENEPTPFKLD